MKILITILIILFMCLMGIKFSELKEKSDEDLKKLEEMRAKILNNLDNILALKDYAPSDLIIETEYPLLNDKITYFNRETKRIQFVRIIAEQEVKLNTLERLKDLSRYFYAQYFECGSRFKNIITDEIIVVKVDEYDYYAPYTMFGGYKFTHKDILFSNGKHKIEKSEWSYIGKDFSDVGIED